MVLAEELAHILQGADRDRAEVRVGDDEYDWETVHELSFSERRRRPMYMNVATMEEFGVLMASTWEEDPILDEMNAEEGEAQCKRCERRYGMGQNSLGQNGLVLRSENAGPESGGA